MIYKPGIDLVCVSYMSSSDLHNFGVTLERHAPTVDFSLTVVNVCPGINDTNIAKRTADLFSEARVLEFADNVGYGYACNQGGADGNREIVGLFNVDMSFRDAAIDRCCEQLLGHDNWGLCGPRQTNSLGRHTAGGIYGTDTAPEHHWWMAQDDGRMARETRDDCTVVVGSAMFIRRSVWDELTGCSLYRRHAPRPNPVGPLLETPLLYEDAWLSYHARGHDWKCGFVGDAHITHEWHGAIKYHGGDQHMAPSKELFRHSCDEHGLAHD